MSDLPNGVRRGTAIKEHASPEMLLPRSPAARHRQAAPAPDAGRFSPLNAPQRALVEGFTAEAERWAMRQARRSYRHLPAELQEQAFDQAVIALRTSAPAALDRRTLYAELAERLDEELRRIHIGWCLNQTRAERPQAGTAPAEPTAVSRHPITGFIEESLGGLERAVLQLELGAGRDSHTVRAALRLGPRQYARHREIGLGKLRGAIAGGLSGQVCAQHLDSVTMAATGDRDAASRLDSGPGRCRACAREAATLRRLLQQRLALAPWPLAIKPAGAIAAKLGALGALFGGKGATGAGAIGLGGAGGATSAKVVAAVVASAAIASGGIATVEGSDLPAKSAAAAASAARTAPVAAAPAPLRRATTTSRSERRAATRKRRAAQRNDGAQPAQPASTAPIQTAAYPPATGAPVTTTGSGPAATGPVGKTVDEVKSTVGKVTGKLPVKVPAVDDAVPALDPALGGVTGVVDGLLKP